MQDWGNNSLKGGNTNIQTKAKTDGKATAMYSCTTAMFTVNFCQPTHTCSTSSLWTAFCHQTHQLVHSHTQSDTPQHSHVFKMSAVSALKRNYITSIARATCNNAHFLFLLLLPSLVARVHFWVDFRPPLLSVWVRGEWKLSGMCRQVVVLRLPPVPSEARQLLWLARPVSGFRCDVRVRVLCAV